MGDIGKTEWIKRITKPTVAPVIEPVPVKVPEREPVEVGR